MSHIDPAAYCWYHSETKLGLIYLGIEASEAELANLQGQHRVFQQAALLANTETMIQAVELWQGIDLDLYPCEAPGNTAIHLSMKLKDASSIDAQANQSDAAPTSSDEVQADSPDANEAEVKADTGESITEDESPPTNLNTVSVQQKLVIVFDSAVLIQLESLSEELESVLDITSPTVDFRVQLDQLTVTTEEMEKIETGAVVVIPAAYQPEWNALAVSNCADIPLRFEGRVSQSEQSLQVALSQHVAQQSADKPASTEDTTEQSVALWCQQICSIPVLDLLGIGTAVHATQPYKLDAGALSLVQNESTIAHGSLLSYGRGSVVAVSERLRD